MGNIKLSENCISIICKHYSCQEGKETMTDVDSPAWEIDDFI